MMYDLGTAKMLHRHFHFQKFLTKYVFMSYFVSKNIHVFPLDQPIWPIAKFESVQLHSFTVVKTIISLFINHTNSVTFHLWKWQCYACHYISYNLNHQKKKQEKKFGTTITRNWHKGQILKALCQFRKVKQNTAHLKRKSTDRIVQRF